jgi:Protein of unknown function (DUF3605)
MASTEVDTNEESDDDSTQSLRIQLPILKYGYRTAPCTWDELVQILGDVHTGTPPDLDRLSRSVQQQTEYQIYQQKLLKKWRSVLDSILCKTFDTIFTPSVIQIQQPPNRPLFIAVPPLSDIKTTHTRLARNDFPYYMEPGIDHYVLWKIGGEPCNDDDIRAAQQQLLLQSHQEGIEYDESMLHWTNPHNLKSIPEVDHVHILARRRQQQTKSP